jgi:predicted O-methyltransferase YrrM
MEPLTDWIAKLFDERDLLRMGHAQRAEDLNLGLGWLYYALVRVVRPKCAVVIGSYRGFVPLVLARALSDNAERGELYFIEPSLVDDFWKDDLAVRDYFGSFGCGQIRHYRQTTQEFVESKTYQQLEDIGILFIDGYHSAEQAEFDFDVFADKLAPQGLVLLHDSVWRLPSRIYGPGREYVQDVVDFIEVLKGRPQWQVLDLPLGDGVTVVRRSELPDPPARRKQTISVQSERCAS